MARCTFVTFGSPYGAYACLKEDQLHRCTGVRVHVQRTEYLTAKPQLFSSEDFRDYKWAFTLSALNLSKR